MQKKLENFCYEWYQVPEVLKMSPRQMFFWHIVSSVSFSGIFNILTAEQFHKNFDTIPKGVTKYEFNVLN